LKEILLKVTYQTVSDFKAAIAVGDKVAQALLGREKYHGYINAEYHEEFGWRAIELTIEPQSSCQKVNKDE